MQDRKLGNGVARQVLLAICTIAYPAMGVHQAVNPSKQQEAEARLFTANSDRIDDLLAKSSGDIVVRNTVLSDGGFQTFATRPKSEAEWIQMRLDSFVCDHDLIVLGTFGTGTSHRTSDDKFLYTDWPVLVDTVIKNGAAAPVKVGNTITVAHTGGVMKINGHTVMAVDDNFSRSFTAGERCLLFLTYIPASGTYGMFSPYTAYSLSGDKVGSFASFPHAPRIETLDKAHLMAGIESAVSSMGNPPRSGCKGATP